MPKLNTLDDVNMIFVCGCPHSGTSLVTQMIGAHPDIYSIAAETSVFNKDFTDEQIRDVLAKHLPEVEAKGAHYLCEKTPNHLRRLDKMRSMFPGAPIVIIVRDPRDVSMSLRERDGDLDRGIKRWVQFNGIARDAKEAGWPVHILKYEELIENPQQVLTALCEYLGVPFTPAMLEYYKDEREWNHAKGREETDGQWGDKHRNLRNWQVHQPLLDRRGRWRDKLTADEVRQIETQSKPLMDYFGYSLA